MHHVSLLAVFEFMFVVAGFALTIAVSWRVSKGGGGVAVSELSEANKVLERRVHELRKEYEEKIAQLGAEVRDLRVENAELRTRTNYQAVINEHERRAEERHGRTLAVLELMAARFGPDPS